MDQKEFLAVICEECPCMNSDSDEGSTCNMDDSVSIDYDKVVLNGKEDWLHLTTDECKLGMVIGDEKYFIPRQVRVTRVGRPPVTREELDIASRHLLDKLREAQNSMVLRTFFGGSEKRKGDIVTIPRIGSIAVPQDEKETDESR